MSKPSFSRSLLTLFVCFIGTLVFISLGIGVPIAAYYFARQSLGQSQTLSIICAVFVGVPSLPSCYLYAAVLFMATISAFVDVLGHVVGLFSRDAKPDHQLGSTSNAAEHDNNQKEIT